MLTLIQGALVMACAIVGLFFVRFWSRTRDRLFLYFALAFWVLSAHWMALGALDVPLQTRYSLYLPRLLAFSLIIAGIVGKNRSSR
jgi:hypothetical protein